METFTQIIFPPKVKAVEVVQSVTSYVSHASKTYKPDQVYCNIRRELVESIDCVLCDKGTKNLGQIFMSGFGC